MLNAIRYAREEQGALLRHLPRHADRLHRIRAQCLRTEARANSGEFDPATPHRIIYKLRELTGVEEMGGTMRLGAWDCVLEPDSLAANAYGTTEISERHRHRYEFNREYEARARPAPACASPAPRPTQPTSRSSRFPTHPFFLGCQFHPEFKSKPLEPHPLFRDFVGAAYKNRGLHAASIVHEGVTPHEAVPAAKA